MLLIKLIGRYYFFACSLILHIGIFGTAFIISYHNQQGVDISGTGQTRTYQVALAKPKQLLEPVQIDFIPVTPQKPREPEQIDVKAEKPAEAVPPKDEVSYTLDKSVNEIEVYVPARPASDSIRNKLPYYPSRAIELAQEGVVILLVAVETDGSLSDIRIIQSSGYQLLDDSALATVRKWKFTPATQNGKPVSSQVRVPIRFKLVD
ncbi:MAG: energy transducer TonB [Planctomycetes bacterium]|nr:energy transducer TonB [Planctomycetota bacterium]